MDPSNLSASQLELMQEMNRTLQQQSEILNTISERLSGQSAAFQQVTQSAAEATDAMDKNSQSTGAIERGLKSVSEWFDGVTSKIKGFVGEKLWDKFANGGAAAFELLGINAASLKDAITNPIAAAMGFLTDMWSTLVAKAADLAHQGTAFARALEEVRDKFGDLTQNTSRQVVAVGKNMSATLRDAAGGTAAFASKFSPGVDGAIERMHMAMEIAGDLGSTFDALGNDFTNASSELYVLKKGLDFTSEGMQATARLAMLSGQSLKTFSQGIMASVDKIGKQFGMSTKVLGSDVGKALSNFKMLGKMTGDYVKEITKAAVFTRKMGIELNTLTGLVDKFDDFEQGAEAAAQLAQGFGLVIDPLKMMGMEAGPRLAELQKAFVATGRSIDSMSRQERSLLAQTAGLSDEQLQLAFSQKGLSMSYDEISKGADAAAKRQATTQEIMNDLALNIKNVIVDMQSFTGFIEAFFSGFGVGFIKGGLMNLIRQIAHQLREVYVIGIQVGRMFSQLLFNGDAENTGTKILSMFKKVGTMFVNIAESIKSFVSELKAIGSGDISGAVTRLITNIFGNIRDTFTSAAGGLDLKGMAIKFGTILVQVLRGATRWLVTDGIPNWIKTVREAFTGTGGASSMALDAIKDGIRGITSDLGDMLPLLYDLGKELLKMIPRIFENFPIASAVTGLFLGLGPIATFIAEFIQEFFTQASSTIASVASGGATQSDQAAATAGVVQGVTSTMETAVGNTVRSGSGMFDRLFGVLEDPIKILATAGSIAILIKAIGIALRDTMRAFLEPLEAGSPTTFIDLIAEAAGKFSSISGADLMTVGVILAGVGGAIGFFVSKIAEMVSSLPSGSLLSAAGLAVKMSPALIAIAAVLGISASTGAAGWIAGKVIGGIADSVASMIRNIVFAFTNVTFIASIKSAADLGVQLSGQVIGLSSLSSVMSSIAAVVTSVKTALDVLTTIAPDLGAAETSARELASQEISNKLIALGRAVGDTAPAVRMAFDQVAAAFPDNTATGGASTVEKINFGAKSMVALAGAMGSIASAMTSVGTILTTFDTIAPKGTFGGSRDTEAVTKGIEEAIKMLFGDRTSDYNPVKGIAGAILKIPFLDKAAFDLRAESLNTMKGILTAFVGSVQSLSSITTSDTTGFADNLRALMVGGGPLEQLYFLFGTSQTPGATFLQLPTVAGDLMTRIDSIFDVMDHYVYRASATSEGMAQDKMQQYSTRVSAIVGYIAQTRKILEDLGTIPLDATIDKLGNNMSVAKSAFSIAGGAVKINVQLNVTMNAEKLSTGLVVGGYLKASDEFDRYLLTNDGVGEMYNSPVNTYNNRPDGIATGENSALAP